MASTPTTLWNRNFILYWLGLVGSALGDAFVFVALPFLVLNVNEAPTALATAVVFGSLPRFLGPAIGSVADRLRLKAPLIAVGLVRAFLFALVGLLAANDDLGLELLYGAAFLNGLLTVFVVSAGSVVVPRLVPTAQLSRANSLLYGASMGLPLVGYGVAGALVATIGPGLAVATTSPLFLGSALTVSFIRFPEVVRSEGADFLSDLWRGARYVFVRAPLAVVLVLSFMLNAALATLNIAVPLAMEALGRGATGYGIFQSVMAVGTLGGVLAVSVIGSRLGAPFQVGLANTLIAVGFGLIVPGNFSWFLSGAVFVGFGLGMTEVAAVTLLQLAVPDGMRGKVLGIVFAANALGLTLGAWSVGQFAEQVGLMTLYVAMATLLVAVSTLWLWVNLKYPDALEPLGDKTA